MTHPYAGNGEHTGSYYAASANPTPLRRALTGIHETDICVVGAGYSGLSTALHLAEKGYTVTLIEGARIGWGASGRNGGQVGSGQRLEQDALEKMVGDTRARALWEMGEAAKALVQYRIAAHDIKADYRAGIAHACWTGAQVRHAHASADRLRRAILQNEAALQRLNLLRHWNRQKIDRVNALRSGRLRDS